MRRRGRRGGVAPGRLGAGRAAAGHAEGCWGPANSECRGPDTRGSFAVQSSTTTPARHLAASTATTRCVGGCGLLVSLVSKELKASINSAYCAYSDSNALFPGIFPALRKFELDVVRMTKVRLAASLAAW